MNEGRKQLIDTDEVTKIDVIIIARLYYCTRTLLVQINTMKHKLTCFGVLSCQHVVGKRRGVGETLQG